MEANQTKPTRIFGDMNVKRILVLILAAALLFCAAFAPPKVHHALGHKDVGKAIWAARHKAMAAWAKSRQTP